MGNRDIERIRGIKSLLEFIVVLFCLLSCPQALAAPADIGGYRLDLTGASGKTESLSIFEPDKGSDRLLVINGNNYLKDDGQWSARAFAIHPRHRENFMNFMCITVGVGLALQPSRGCESLADRSANLPESGTRFACLALPFG